LGVVPASQAMEKAREANLDLVEVAPDERPPVCRILDYGKMRFENSQKNNKSGKVRQQKLKEIRVRPLARDPEGRSNPAFEGDSLFVISTVSRRKTAACASTSRSASAPSA
jgi:hypothetical protein